MCINKKFGVLRRPSKLHTMSLSNRDIQRFHKIGHPIIGRASIRSYKIKILGDKTIARIHRATNIQILLDKDMKYKGHLVHISWETEPRVRSCVHLKLAF